jgi:PAT family beta-lactamase induction signal transducer AmpG
MSAEKRIPHPVLWVPSSYLAEGIPFAMVSWASATMFKSLGHTDGEITVPIASVGIAWSLKPLWAAFLDRYRTKKFFVLAMEFAMALLLAGVALALPLPNYFQAIMAILWVLAFASATQDICVDGVYITSLDKKRQSAWMGTQGVFWTLGRLFATSAVVWLAGRLTDLGYEVKQAWMYAVGFSAITMGVLCIYHYFMLPTGSRPRPPAKTDDEATGSWNTRIGISVAVGVALGALIAWTTKPIIGLVIGSAVIVALAIGWRDHVPPFKAFFQKQQIWWMLLFVFLYRTGEGFLLVEAPLFLQANVDKGGVGLTLEQKALVDGLVSTVVSLAGGLLGGAVAAKYGLKRVLLFLALSMNIPHLCYIFLSQAVTPGTHLPLWMVYLLVSIEKFGYSFGFIGNMLYMMQQIAPGKYKMTHYAYATAFMNLVLWPTQALSGPLADWMGYRSFFIFVLIASIPSVIVAWKAKFPNAADTIDEDDLPVVETPEQAAAARAAV